MGSNSSCKQAECMKFQKKSNHAESAVIEVYNNKFFVKGAFNFNKQSTFKKLQIAANQLCSSSGIGAQYIPTVMRLLAFKHDNVFQAFSTLNKQNRIQFIDKICEIHLDLMDSLYQFLILNQDKKRIIKQLKLCPLKPFQGLQFSGIKIEDRFDLTNKGIGLLRASKVVIVFMCAGASSRFFFQDKFLHPLQIGNQQTTVLKILFQKLRENYRSKSKQEIIDLPIVLIGNQTNTDLIETYLKENKFFNFNMMSIYFSSIPSLPILNDNGKICLNFEYNYLRRPKGSACYLQQILHPRALKVLQQKKIQYIHLVGTENLAESPGDPLFLGLTHMLKRKVSIKCTSPNHSLEKFDRLINCEDRVRIIDSDSLQQIDRNELFESNVAMNSMIFSLDSLNELIQKFNQELHFAGLYRAFSINQNIYDFASKKPLVNQACWAFQKDIKDTISCADKPLILKVDRSEFIPIVTPKNQYSIEQAIEAYIKFHTPKIHQLKNSLQSSKASTSQKQKHQISEQRDQIKEKHERKNIPKTN